MILVDISLVMSKVERFFTCLRTVCVSFYADHLHPCPFFTGFFLFFFLLLTCRILFHFLTLRALGLPRWLSSKEFACNVGDLGLIPGSGRSPGEGNCNPLQYSCLGNPMDRGAEWATVHGVAKSQTRLSD